MQASTCYGYDNSYLCDATARFSNRFTAVGSVDVLQADAPKMIRHWVERGTNGFRLFTGGSTAAFDPSTLDDPRSFPSWQLIGELGLSMCIQIDPVGLAQVAGLAKRFPKVRIVLDHLGRPDVTDGPPYKKASSLFGLAIREYLSEAHAAYLRRCAEKASAETFFPRLIEVFGANRLAWGSIFPASEGKLSSNLEVAKKCLASVSEQEREWIFAKTAQVLYPALA